MPQGSRPGLTLDTGAMIAIERRDRKVMSFVDEALAQERLVTVPTVVLVEWWRGQRGRARRLLQSFDVEQLSERLALLAGEALAQVGAGPSIADAIVMASAAQRGDMVLTADFDDLDSLRAVFPAVRVLGVNRSR